MLKVATTTFKNELEALWQAWGTFWFDRINNNWYLLGCTVIFCLGFVTISTFAKSLTPLFAVLGFVVFASAMAAVTYVSVEMAPLGVKESEPRVVDLLAAVLIQEAGGEGDRGMGLVYDVICARANLSKKSKYEVVMETSQFSCLNGREPRQIIRWSRKHERWESAKRIVLLNMLEVPGAYPLTHYHATSVMPSWADREIPILKHGKHIFYRLPYP